MILTHLPKSKTDMPAPDPVALHSPTEVAAIVLTSCAWVERVRLPEYDTLTFCTLKLN